MSVGQGLKEAAADPAPLPAPQPETPGQSTPLTDGQNSSRTWQGGPKPTTPIFLAASLPQPTQKGSYQEEVKVAFRPWLWGPFQAVEEPEPR